ncbi:Smr domain containing protein [Coccidioides posadasii C735 delta SOWgp]|uniref:Smr domain-containing protein n=2 Tax=Coccidioides posadasii TaxID=199306 RepID=A0A0J6F8I5_COCPO|nr:Smr domain containing protein [Coccidioides posadasii C735 delta SOWgp]EER23770.1 Smr domain containing protein [Coccidioides posadasii C735 delta SOWgp]KMM65249.1 hypothetical protein CPAG_01600 [Coccidioides posadasii RMSCC 3488]|eukprot:XP_003065915.1 Smr domain containing protein [Coccidioides posadasii C735 delta SOWgp]
MAEPVTTSLMEELESEYCPRLDPALFAAIASDFNLDDNPSGIAELRATLDFVAAQSSCDSDPYGTGERDVFEEDGVVSEPSVPPSQKTLQSSETNPTSLESSPWSVENEEPAGKQNQTKAKSYNPGPAPFLSQKGAAFSGFDLEEKQEYLKEMFPSIAQYTISHTLGKCNGDIDRSMDVLLNLAFFEDSSRSNNGHKDAGADADDGQISIPKGIEGFDGPISHKKGRKRGKGKGKQSKTKQLLEQSISACAEDDLNPNKVDNRWDNGKKDVDFICSRTYLSTQASSSAYHLNAAHLPTTIHYLAKKEIEKHPQVMEDAVTIQQVAELREDFSTVSPEKLGGLLRLARNSISAANELARVMIAEPEAPLIEATTPRAILPPNLTQTGFTPVRKTKKVVSPLLGTGSAAASLGASRALANHHRRAGEIAFNKAHAAYRRGKSDHLMGGAAGYYSSVGREHIEIAKRETSAAADALVDSQSTGNVLDLHGVSVQDGVRIACERVEAWWESLGDARYAPGGGGPVREGYKIITGLGRHSRNGTARLGPAVARRLAKDGWRVEVGQGQLTVAGLVRHR